MNSYQIAAAIIATLTLMVALAKQTVLLAHEIRKLTATFKGAPAHKRKRSRQRNSKKK